MKAIIASKLYDTDNAHEIESWDNGIGYDWRRDFKRIVETLYRTDAGAWFLWRAGGAMTEFAVHHSGNMTVGSQSIRPLCEDEAYAWLEEKRKVEAIETHFGDRIKAA